MFKGKEKALGKEEGLIVMKKKKLLLKNIPVILCEERSDLPGGMTFWCPFCKHQHFHGEGEGHRSAHCSEDSPFDKTGYILKLRKNKMKFVKKD